MVGLMENSYNNTPWKGFATTALVLLLPVLKLRMKGVWAEVPFLLASLSLKPTAGAGRGRFNQTGPSNVLNVKS